MSGRFIVAEVSRNWPGAGTLLSERFEAMIEVNLLRGYTLHSWHLNRVETGAEIPGETVLNETIVAVFERPT